MKFSVLLLYPDYVADDFGSDTFFTHVEQPTIADAIKSAQEDAASQVEQEPPSDPNDWFPLLVLYGWHDDVNL